MFTKNDSIAFSLSYSLLFSRPEVAHQQYAADYCPTYKFWCDSQYPIQDGFI